MIAAVIIVEDREHLPSTPGIDLSWRQSIVQERTEKGVIWPLRQQEAGAEELPSWGFRWCAWEPWPEMRIDGGAEQDPTGEVVVSSTSGPGRRPSVQFEAWYFRAGQETMNNGA